ncbi:MAG TPA: hypothetical protein DG753_01085 [Clostridium sp.]|nr:hypothetical protein [Clostridium sp.]
MSPNTIELERTLLKLEHMASTSRGSLEISLIERFKNTLKNVHSLEIAQDKDIYSWWDMLNRDFKTLNENYQDYISTFYSPKTEQMLKTTEFLLFKENFIRYLRTFVKGLQLNGSEIREIFSEINDDLIKDLMKTVVDYEKNNISLDKEYDSIYELDVNYGDI